MIIWASNFVEYHYEKHTTQSRDVLLCTRSYITAKMQSNMCPKSINANDGTQQLTDNDSGSPALVPATNGSIRQSTTCKKFRSYKPWLILKLTKSEYFQSLDYKQFLQETITHFSSKVAFKEAPDTANVLKRDNSIISSAKLKQCDDVTY